MSDPATTETIPLGLWEIDNFSYHRDHSAIGSSMISDFRESVLLYHEKYVAKTIAPDEPTDAMKIGTALHALVLEPCQFANLVAVGPDCDRRSNANKERWAHFEAQCKGMVILKPEQHKQVRCMVDALRHNQLAQDLLDAAGKREQSIRWKDQAGLCLKARFDAVLDAGIIVDLKTTTSLAGYKWRSTVNQFGLHRQAALYLDGWRRVIGSGQGQHLHMVFTSEPPCEVAVMELDAAALMLGDQQNRSSLNQLAECYASGVWASRHANRINLTQLPKYAFYDEEQSA